MRIVLTALVMAATLGSAAAVEPPEPALDPFDLHIEIGRWGYMMSTVTGHTNDPDGAEPGSEEPGDPRALARTLRETVWEYNLRRSELCTRGVLVAATCGGGYAPAWLSEPHDAAPSLEELKARSSAVGEVVMPLWDAVCEEAATRVEDPQERMYVCPME